MELDDFLLHNCNFTFNCAKGMISFLDRLSSFQQEKIRNITIEILGNCWCCDRDAACKDWTTLYRNLPSTLASLKSIDFDIGDWAYPVPQGGREGFWDYTGDYDEGNRRDVGAAYEAEDLTRSQGKNRDKGCTIFY